MRTVRDYYGLASQNYWPGVADSLLAALMIIMLLAFGGLALFHLNPNRSDVELMRVKRLITSLETKLATLTNENARLNDELNDKPPIIKIDEATREYRFESGSAVMSREFSEGLNQREFQTLAQEILRRNAGSLLKVDTLEIIGHTDGQPIAKKGNLDQFLPEYLSGKDTSVHKMQAGSNNDLGLLRALAVRDAWNDFVNHHPSADELRKISVRCYSAGQTIPEVGNPDDPQTFRLADKRYRRIEVRLTKLK